MWLAFLSLHSPSTPTWEVTIVFLLAIGLFGLCCLIRLDIDSWAPPSAEDIHDDMEEMWRHERVCTRKARREQAEHTQKSREGYLARRVG